MSETAAWSFGLIRDLKVPSNHIVWSDLAVVMRDKYPKARHHFLVLPWASIDNVYELTREHIPLLYEMLRLGEQVVELSGQKLTNFAMGFHMRPHMHRLHLHVISKDFVSERLKQEKHWNIFNTDFFMPFSSIVRELKKQGHIEHRSEAYIESLINTPLQCNQCERQFDALPALKEHLMEHIFISAGRLPSK